MQDDAVNTDVDNAHAQVVQWRRVEGLKDGALSLSFLPPSYQPSLTPFRMTSQSSNMVTFEWLGMVESSKRDLYKPTKNQPLQSPRHSPARATAHEPAIDFKP